MKFAEFREMCEREWGEARGDVTGLCLTDESFAELGHDVLAEGVPNDFELLRLRDEPVNVTRIRNPLTGSVVKIDKGAASDTAEVRRHYAKALEVTGEAEVPRGRLAGQIRCDEPGA